VGTSYTDLDKALDMGAVALFDEKYSGKVRLVRIGDYSLELCGGTHVRQTGEIGIFKILSEGGVGAGVRRIEALTGDAAYRYFAARDELLKSASTLLKASPENLNEKLVELLESHKELQRKIKLFSQKLVKHQIEAILQQTDHSLGIPVLSAQVDAQSMEELREYLDRLRDKMGSGIILLGTLADGKVLLAAAVTQDLVKKGFHAGKLIGEAARLTGGGGGGRPDMAQAGGKNAQQLPEALSRVVSLVQQQQGRSDKNGRG
jgi:alanyl-tRNA synthetase